MCPLYPFHLILLYLCLLLPLLLAVVEGAEELTQMMGKKGLKLSYDDRKKIQEHELFEMTVSCLNCPPDSATLILSTNDEVVASIDTAHTGKMYHQKRRKTGDSDDSQEVVVDLAGKNGEWSFGFNVSADFLGFAVIKADVRDEGNRPLLEESARIAVLRRPTTASKAFIATVAGLVTLAYVNMGCAIDLDVVKAEIRRPVGPAIGFIAQFLVMPIVSFAAGYIFDSAPMRLGLFVTGVSPGGGASNMWTLMFGGNLHLSLTMTAVSTFSAFFMMPLWILTLGKITFDEYNIVVPYRKIMMYASCLMIPLMVGVAIKRYLPKLSDFLVKILKPMALAILIFIIAFGIYANQYIFWVMDWKVWLVGMVLPWTGFLFGCFMAMIGRQPLESVSAIAIETGVQNTGVSIFILLFTLDRPLGDLAAVVPVAVAMMTPIPLFTALIVLKIRSLLFVKSPSTEYISGEVKEGSYFFTKDANGACKGNVKLGSISKIVEEKA